MPTTYGTELLLKTAEQSFWNSYYDLPDPFDGLIYTRQSTQSVDTLARLGAAPLPVEWVGDKEAKTVPELSYTVTNVNYDATVKIDKKLVKFQQFDVIGNLVSNMGAKARAHRTYLASAALEAGFATAGDDTQFFFDTDHRDPGSTYSTTGDYQNNDLAPTAADTSNPTATDAQVALRAAFAAILGFKDDQGHPASTTNFPDANNFIVMVPASGTWPTSFNQVRTAETISAAGDNDLQGTFTLRINPWLTGTTIFYTFWSGDQHKPLIWNEASGIETEMERDFASGHYRYSANYWGTLAYGNWRRAVGSTFA